MADQDIRASILEVYDLLRTTSLNCKYYAHQLNWWRKTNLAYEILTAIGTSGTIGAWAIWKVGAGQYIWTSVAAITAILVVLKPIFQLPKEIERYSKLYSGFIDLFYDLDEVVKDIKRTHTFTPEMAKTVTNARSRFKELAPQEDLRPNRILVQRFYEEVKNEIPSTRLWSPSS